MTDAEWRKNQRASLQNGRELPCAAFGSPLGGVMNPLPQNNAVRVASGPAESRARL